MVCGVRRRWRAGAVRVGRCSTPAGHFTFMSKSAWGLEGVDRRLAVTRRVSGRVLLLWRYMKSSVLRDSISPDHNAHPTPAHRPTSISTFRSFSCD
ncbi:hypothetical protein QQF64_002871 [Cirrhinus molitorella]|uniref:Uncharacterized protein n=1 Tax=Cirrhinus molitorella TaxID=172907 RepID=A0ABR3MRF0_9TELE